VEVGGAYSELSSQLATQKRQMQPSAPIGIEFWAIRSPRSHKQRWRGEGGVGGGRGGSLSSSHREEKKTREIPTARAALSRSLATLSGEWEANIQRTMGTHAHRYERPPALVWVSHPDELVLVLVVCRRWTSGDSTQKSVSCWAVSVQVHRRSARAAANSSVLPKQDASFSAQKRIEIFAVRFQTRPDSPPLSSSSESLSLWFALSPKRVSVVGGLVSVVRLVVLPKLCRRRRRRHVGKTNLLQWKSFRTFSLFVIRTLTRRDRETRQQQQQQQLQLQQQLQ